MDNTQQLPDEVVERIDLEAKQYAFYNYVTAADDAKFEDFKTWPQYAQVAYYSIKHYIEGDVNCWPYTSKTLPMEYATKLHHAEQENKELKDQIEKYVLDGRDKEFKGRTLLEKIISRHGRAVNIADPELYNEIKQFLDGK